MSPILANNLQHRTFGTVLLSRRQGSTLLQHDYNWVLQYAAKIPSHPEPPSHTATVQLQTTAQVAPNIHPQTVGVHVVVLLVHRVR